MRAVLGQTFGDLELIVVDDGSADGTGEVLAGIPDPRLGLIRNETALGLAGALNVGLQSARGRYVARMDADDVALPGWIDHAVTRIRSEPAAAIVGTGTIDLHGDGTLGAVHRMPSGARAVRWAALFSSPFFHPTVIVDRAVLDREGLRYDPVFGESEDYDLWARLLAVADGDNVPHALVLYRRHGGQASARRAALQLEFRRRVALRQIDALLPRLGAERADLAWRAGGALPLPPGAAADACQALRELVEEFEARLGGREARRAAAWALARHPDVLSDGGALARAALALDPALPLGGLRRLGLRRAATAERRDAGRLRARAAGGPVRLAVVLPEPTPYRTGMLDLLALRPDVDLTVVYAGSSVQRRTWDVAHRPPRGARGRMARPRRLPPPPPRLPALRRGARRASRGAARRRRRLRLEHLRVADGGRVVSAARRSVRPPRRVERARRAPGLAADGEERSRPYRRGWRSRGTGRRVARARCDARPRCRRRPDHRRREHDRRRGVRPGCGCSRAAPRRASGGVGHRRERRGRPLRGAPGAREGSRHACASGRGGGRSTPRRRAGGIRPRAEPSRVPRRGHRCPAPPPARDPVGADRRALRRRRRLRAPLTARALGRRGERGGVVRSPSCPVGPRGRGVRPPRGRQERLPRSRRTTSPRPPGPCARWPPTPRAAPRWASPRGRSSPAGATSRASSA